MMLAVIAWYTVLAITNLPMLGGRQGRDLAVVVTSPFSFRHLLATYTLPTGRYAAKSED
jgi:hypothetical protein